VWRWSVLQLQQYLPHPCHVSRLSRLWSLDNNDPRLLLLLLIFPRTSLLNVGNLMRDKF
jgi:hypothetical protein